jgi:hypothetical protein
MASQARDKAVKRFCSYDGQKAKIIELSRHSKRSEDKLARVLRLCGAYVLQFLEGLLVRPRALICDASGTVGYNIHRHATKIVSTKCFSSYSSCIQFCGRVSRLAPEQTEPTPFHLNMPYRMGTIEKVLFLPAVQNGAEEADASSGRMRTEEDKTIQEPRASTSAAPQESPSSSTIDGEEIVQKRKRRR